SGACGYSPAAVTLVDMMHLSSRTYLPLTQIYGFLVLARQAKAVKDLSRPAGKLCPQVHGQTLKYNMKLRECRGISLEELKDGRIGCEEFQVRMKEGLEKSISWQVSFALQFVLHMYLKQ
nr:60S ribosomal protein L13-1-like [Tanacetum cinerariifolium]